jgi:hypothetical protein
MAVSGDIHVPAAMPQGERSQIAREYETGWDLRADIDVKKLKKLLPSVEGWGGG